MLQKWITFFNLLSKLSKLTNFSGINIWEFVNYAPLVIGIGDQDCGLGLWSVDWTL